MKKLLRLAAIFLTPLLLVVFVNVALAERPISRHQIGQVAIQARLDAPLISPTGRQPSNQGPITGRAIEEVSIIHTTPALLNEPVFFTATILSNTSLISYSWSFGDGNFLGPNAGAVVSHTYDAIDTYKVEVTAQDVDETKKGSILLTVTAEPPSELSIVHSTPTLVNTPIDFTAVVVGGTEPIAYVWSFGDGTQLTENPGPTVSHTYMMTGTYTVVATASNMAGFDNGSTEVTVEAEPITGLAIAHSFPLLTHIPVVFTATKLTGTQPIAYAWSFGDGSAPVFNAGPVQSHVFTEPNTYTVTVIASNQVGPPVSTSTMIAISPNPEPPFTASVYLPFILKDAAVNADLTCNNLSIDPAEPTAGQEVLITFEIRNQGLASADGFWVDLYLDPDTIPGPAGNLFPWQDACGGPSSCTRGIAWGIADNPLGAGEVRILTSVPMTTDHPNGFISNVSNWDGQLPAGQHDIYVYVDSIDNPVLPNTDGTVMEINEQNNLCEPLNVVVSPSDMEVEGRLPAVSEPNQADDKSTSGSGLDSQSQSWSSKLPPR